MPIKSLDIKNFQAHKELHLDLSKNIVTITGESDRGKSAILRSLIWLATNRPSGDDFIRYGANECAVKAIVDGHTIERVKGKKTNSYILDGVEYKALKTDVPEEIAKILNIDRNNIQQQFDPIFWFSQTPGEVGKNLNQIVNLEIIDNVMYELQSKSKTIKAEIGVLDTMIAEQETLLENQFLILKICDVADRIDEFVKESKQNQQNINKLESILNSVQQFQKRIEEAEEWQALYSRLEVLFDQYVDNAKKEQNLESCLRRIESVQLIIHQEEIPEQLFDFIERTLEEDKKLVTQRKQWKKLFSIVEDIEDAQKRSDKLEADYKKTEKELHKILDNNVCPLCGRGGKDA